MLILKETTKVELMVKNSRFIAEAIPVTTPDAARDIVNEKRKNYADSSHVVFAFIVGPQANVMGCSDAGEPSGTAGRPTLAVLKGSNITNIVLTTARWFGGTKLGTGGLVHAYSECAKVAIEDAVTCELIEKKNVSFAVPYNLYDQLKRTLSALEFDTQHEEFTNEISISGEIKSELYPALKEQLCNLTNGKVNI